MIETILSRTSIRQFTDQPVSDEDIRTILKAGMSGPSTANTRPWSFLVVKDKETLSKMADANGIYAGPLRNAAFGILVLGDSTRFIPQAPDYWLIDASIASQNMILAAKALGIGSVWLGTWPQMERVEGQRELFNIPDTHIPHTVIAFGYPAENPPVRAPEWEEGRVHFEKW